jgi:intergrase/recombinase
VLLQNDAQDLLNIESVEKRMNVMKSLTVLAKYTGSYDRWQEMRKRYSLKWSKGDSIQSFERFFNPEQSLDVILQRIREMVDKTPTQMANIIKFDCLTGLRPAEAVEAVRLINDKEAFAKYYNPEQMTLQHYRFPSVFLRATKKAFVSFMTPDMLDIIKNNNNIDDVVVPSYNAIRLACRKRGINMDMRFCRKLFASWLHQCGISDFVIDALQGRVAQSVLVRHYLVAKP